MNKALFLELRQIIIDEGYGEEIVWQESLPPCVTASNFFAEYMWVVISAGMKNQIARIIKDRIDKAWAEGEPTSSAFNHKGKVKAIDYAREHQHEYYEGWRDSKDKLGYLRTLPYIGDITKYHLAKNLGFDIAKPDRHLVRIAESYNITPQALCERLSKETGYRISTVDLIIWRAANLGMILSGEVSKEGV